MHRFRLPPALYIALCSLACVLPLIILFTPDENWSWQKDTMHAIAGMVVALVLTAPAGLAGVLVFVVFLPVLAIGTPTESLAVAGPFFALAGYWQWYSCVPRAFGISPRAPTTWRALLSARGHEVSLGVVLTWFCLWLAASTLFGSVAILATSFHGLALLRGAWVVAAVAFLLHMGIIRVLARRNHVSAA